MEKLLREVLENGLARRLMGVADLKRDDLLARIKREVQDEM